VEDFDPHQLDESEFREEVLSFEFWFQAVDGYLSDRPYGRPQGLAEEPLDDGSRDRLITTLCNYCVGETAALDGASGMIHFAPNRHAKIFLATQVVDEARHLEVFLHRLRELGVDDPEAEIPVRADANLLLFRDRLLGFVAAGDWDAAVFAQNVILETMEYTVFRAHAENADAVTAAVLDGVIKDERRHLGFGENDLGQRLNDDPATRDRLTDVRQELDDLVLRTFASAQAQTGVPTTDRSELGRDYLNAVERLGLTR
jgi:1,2-phenylacetyl-CoA epoxidase catalytic subunit